MNFIKDTLEYVRQLLTWWVEIMPWEEGIRVTLGKHQKKLTAGLWVRLPIIHVVYSQPIRFRMLETLLQTVASKGGDVLSLKMAIGFKVNDIMRLFNSAHDPHAVLSNTALGIASNAISSSEQVTQKEIETAILEGLKGLDIGVEVSVVYITNFAKVRTFRLIGDANYGMTDGENINIKKP